MLKEIEDMKPRWLELLEIRIFNSDHYWQHPEIDELLSEVSTPSEVNEGFVDAPVLRVWLGDIHCVILIDQESYDEYINLEADEDPEIVDSICVMTQVALQEDVYFVAGEQFAFAKSSRAIYKACSDILRNTPDASISPDIGMEKHTDGSWSWSS